MAIIGTHAKASLISKTSTSSCDQPALSSTLAMAPAGATVKADGWIECVACATMRASGCASAAMVSLPITSAEAPSEIELAFAAVIVPSRLKAGRRLGIRSTFERRGCSSSRTSPSGLISASSAPPSIAASALVTEPIAKASMALRVSWRSSAVSCAKLPMEPPVSASSRPSVNIESASSRWPMRSPARAFCTR